MSDVEKDLNKIKQKLGEAVDNNASDEHLVLRKDGDEIIATGNASLINEPGPKVNKYKFLLVKDFDGEEPSESGWEPVSELPGNFKKMLEVSVPKIMPRSVLDQIIAIASPLVLDMSDFYKNGVITNLTDKLTADVVGGFIGNYGGVLRQLASIVTGYDIDVFMDWHLMDMRDDGGGAFIFFTDLVNNTPNLLVNINL
jgi:hypothetical protein